MVVVFIVVGDGVSCFFVDVSAADGVPCFSVNVSAADGVPCFSVNVSVADGVPCFSVDVIFKSSFSVLLPLERSVPFPALGLLSDGEIECCGSHRNCAINSAKRGNSKAVI